VNALLPPASAGQDDPGIPTSEAGGQTLKLHFHHAVELLEQKAAVGADLAEWRNQARGAGLDPRALVKLAREHLRDAEQRRKAAEQEEIEELYRRGLGLPLFEGRA
jgi:uncharacterized protein (UPF0335 family)